MSDQQTPPSRQAVKIQIGPLVLEGPAAAAVVLSILGLGAAAAVWYAVSRPESFREALLSPLWLSAGLWLVMIFYWSARARRRTVAIRTGESAASRSHHQMLLNLALLLAFARLPWTGLRWLPASRLTIVAGLAVQLASMLLDLRAIRQLGRHWSGAVTIKVDHELIRTGPYRLVRHPIYTAMIGMFLGTAIVSGELHGLMAVALCVIAYARKIRMEERGLREAFGKAYDDYRRDTWALIPWVL